MNSYYMLKIANDTLEQINKISRILGIQSTNPEFWTLYNIIQEDEPYFDYIDYYISILESKYELLEEIGVKKEDIVIWFMYAYEQQCNMEFEPHQLYKMGKNNIKFCISCWEK